MKKKKLTLINITKQIYKPSSSTLFDLLTYWSLINSRNKNMGDSEAQADSKVKNPKSK